MADLYFFLMVHFVLLMVIGGTIGYYFSRMYVENKRAEAEIRACEYRTTHMTAEALKEIISFIFYN